MYIYTLIQGLECGVAHNKHNVMVGCFTKQKGDR